MKIHYGQNPRTPSADAEVIGDGRVFVDFTKLEGNNLESVEEGIGLFLNGRLALEMTWSEADELALGLSEVVSVGRDG